MGYLNQKKNRPFLVCRLVWIWRLQLQKNYATLKPIKYRETESYNMLRRDIPKIGREVLFLHARIGGTPPRVGEGAFLRLKDGGILFAYTLHVGRSSGDDAAADIVAVISRNEGESWSAPRTLLRHDEQSRNLMCPSLIRLKNGNIGMVVLRKSGKACVPHFSVSGDEGLTFSKPRPCLESEQYFVVENDHVIRLKNGRILMPMNLHENAFAEHHFYAKMMMLASDDEGESWQVIAGPVEPPFPPDVSETGLQETAVHEMPDGTIRAVSRTDLGCQWECFSRDGGATWSRPVPNRLFTSPDAPLSIKDVGPYTLAIFCSCPKFTGRELERHWGRTPMLCAISDDGGQTFPRLRFLEDDLENGYAYAAVFDGGDYALISYYHSDDLDGVLRSAKMIKISYEELK